MQQAKKESTFNFYGLIYKTLDSIEFKEHDSEDKTGYPFYGFVLVFS